MPNNSDLAKNVLNLIMAVKEINNMIHILNLKATNNQVN